MHPHTNRKSNPPGKARIIRLVSALVVILMLLTFFLVPIFVSSEKGKTLILARVNEAVDGRTDFADLSMGWFKGVRVDDLSFDDASGRTSIRVKQIATKPHYGSLLTGRLSFGKTVVDQPKVSIKLKDSNSPPAKKRSVSKAAGFSPVRASSSPDVKSKSQPVKLPIKRIDLVVNDGSLKVADAKTQAVELSGINSRVNLRPPGNNTDFDVDMAVVSKETASDIHAEGRIKPDKRTGWSLKGTTGSLSVKVTDLDIGSLGPLLTWAGVDVQAQGRVSADLKSRIKDGLPQALSGKIKAANLDVTGSALEGDRLKTDALDVAVNLHKDKDLIRIEELDLKSDWANARLKGVIPTTLKSWEQFVKPDADYGLTGRFQFDLAEACSQMPRTLGLKEEMKVVAGQLAGDIETSVGNGRKLIIANANISGLQGLVEGRTIALSQPVTAAIKVTSDKKGIKYDDVRISAPFARISCMGTPELLEYNADVDLAQFQGQLGQFMYTGPYQVAGEFSSSGSVSSRKSRITAAGSCSLANLRLTKNFFSASQQTAAVDFNLDIDRRNAIVDIAHITARSDLGQISVKDSTVPLSEKAQKPLNLSVAAGNVDLGKLQPFAVLFASIPKEMELAGTAESMISITSEKDAYRLKGDDIRIKNFVVRYPQQQPFEQEQVLVDFDIEVNPRSGARAVRKFELRSPKIEVEFEMDETRTNGRTSLQGRAVCRYDWAALSTIAAPYLPRGLTLYGKRKNTVDFTSEYPADQQDGLLTNLNANTAIGFDRAEYMGLRLGQMETDIRLQKGFLTIAPFSTSLNNGKLNYAAVADFKQKPTLLKTPKPIHIAKDVQIDDEVGRNLLRFMNPIFWDAFNIKGVANFDCEKLVIPLAGASRRLLEIIGTVSIDQLQLQPTDLLSQILSLIGTEMGSRTVKIHPTRFVLQNNRLQYDDMQMDIGDKPVNFKGVIGTENKSLEMTVTLPYTASGQRISLPLTGTIDSPQLDVGRLLQDQLKTRLQEELRKSLERLMK